jgi:hypothetical protein
MHNDAYLNEFTKLAEVGGLGVAKPRRPVADRLIASLPAAGALLGAAVEAKRGKGVKGILNGVLNGATAGGLPLAARDIFRAFKRE